MRSSLYLFFFLVVVFSFTPVFSYLPVVFMHGVNADGNVFDDLIERINDQHPGTPIHKVFIYDNWKSYESLFDQVEAYNKAVQSFNITSKYNIVAHSQGGMIVRAYMEMYGDDRIHNFVSLSAPMMGIYGDTEYAKWFFPNIVYPEISRLVYTDEIQKIFSVAQFWKDCSAELYPRYLEKVKFLTHLNNEVEHDKMEEYRENFLKINLLVCLSGPDDGVIIPYESALWGYFLPNDNGTVVPMRETNLYHSDQFGLKTLDERGGIKTFVIPGVKHAKWHSVPSVSDKYIIPHLV